MPPFNTFVSARLFALSALLCSFGHAADFTVAISPSSEVMESKTPGKSAVWLGYLIYRAQWVNKNLKEAEAADFHAYRPRYAEEVEARAALAELWANFKSNGAAGKDDYLNDLVKVRKAKWMPEYVWVHFRQDFWTDAPGAERLARFKQWSQKNLKGHEPETFGTLVVKPKGQSNGESATGGAN